MRKKSVRWPTDGSIVGSDIDRPCAVGRRLRVPKSVSVSLGLCFSLMYESDDLCFLRKRHRSRQAANSAPSRMPGTKPAANEAPENLVEEPDFEPSTGDELAPAVTEAPLVELAAAPDELELGALEVVDAVLEELAELAAAAAAEALCA